MKRNIRDLSYQLQWPRTMSCSTSHNAHFYAALLVEYIAVWWMASRNILDNPHSCHGLARCQTTWECWWWWRRWWQGGCRPEICMTSSASLCTSEVYTLLNISQQQYSTQYKYLPPDWTMHFITDSILFKILW